MAFLDDIIEKLNADDKDAEKKDETQTKEKDEEKEENKEAESKPRDGLLTYSDDFYKAFEK